ncbi:hypothetical protein Tco_1465667, partial [Tanacetum coccineum]
FYTSAGNPVKEILLKLNLPDHRILKDGGEGKKNYIDKEFMPSFYLEPSTPPSSSSGHVGFAPNLGMSKCSSCKILALKIKILEAKIDIERHLKDHTCTDIAKILRKRSKSDNHGHENGIEYTRARRMLSKVNKINSWSIVERISKKRTKNEAKTTKPDTEWKSVEKTQSNPSPSVKKKVNNKSTPSQPRSQKSRKISLRVKFVKSLNLFKEEKEEKEEKDPNCQVPKVKPQGAKLPIEKSYKSQGLVMQLVV